MSTIDPTEATIREAHSALTNWLMREAFPIWWAFGVDHANGGFREKLGMRCEADPGPRRIRVAARQIYAFTVAGRLGWPGRWQSAVEMGVRYYIEQGIGADGVALHLLSAEGRLTDDGFELYNQAFGLFALACAAPLIADRAAAEAAAVRMRDRLRSAYGHPDGRGFEESIPRSLPLKANPHMHLLEAALAWEEAGGDAGWAAMADGIVSVCLDHFIERSEGWLHEFFDADWAPMPGESGRIVEPGHQYEWAWLLTRWGRRRGRDDALAAARRLVELSEAHGRDPSGRFVVNEILDDRSARDPSARLWPQTERMKAHLILAEGESGVARATHLRAVAAAAEALMAYLDTPSPGLWRDRRMVDGSFRDEPAPASSFYHIVCAIEELDRTVKSL